jgi:hypothetical protein
LSGWRNKPLFDTSAGKAVTGSKQAASAMCASVRGVYPDLKCTVVIIGGSKKN